MVEAPGEQWLSFNAPDHFGGRAVGRTVNVMRNGALPRPKPSSPNCGRLACSHLAGRVIEDYDCNRLRFHLDPQGKRVELEPDMTVGLRIDTDGSYVVWRVRPQAG